MNAVSEISREAIDFAIMQVRKNLKLEFEIIGEFEAPWLVTSVELTDGSSFLTIHFFFENDVFLDCHSIGKMRGKTVYLSLKNRYDSRIEFDCEEVLKLILDALERCFIEECDHLVRTMPILFGSYSGQVGEVESWLKSEFQYAVFQALPKYNGMIVDDEHAQVMHDDSAKWGQLVFTPPVKLNELSEMFELSKVSIPQLTFGIAAQVQTKALSNKYGIDYIRLVARRY